MVLLPVASCELQRAVKSLCVLQFSLGGKIVMAVTYKTNCGPHAYFTIIEVDCPRVYYASEEGSNDAEEGLFLLYHIRPSIKARFLDASKAVSEAEALKITKLTQAVLLRDVGGDTVRCVVQGKFNGNQNVITYVYDRVTPEDDNEESGVQSGVAEYKQFPAPLEDHNCTFVCTCTLVNFFPESSIPNHSNSNSNSSKATAAPLFLAAAYENVYELTERMHNRSIGRKSATENEEAASDATKLPKENSKGNVILLYGGSDGGKGKITLAKVYAFPDFHHCGVMKKMQLLHTDSVDGGNYFTVLCLFDAFLAEVRLPFRSHQGPSSTIETSGRIQRVWKNTVDMSNSASASAPCAFTSFAVRDYYLYITTDSGLIHLFDLRCGSDDDRRRGFVCTSSLYETIDGAGNHSSKDRPLKQRVVNITHVYAPSQATDSIFTTISTTNSNDEKIIEWTPVFEVFSVNGNEEEPSRYRGNGKNDGSFPQYYKPLLNANSSMNVAEKNIEELKQQAANRISIVNSNTKSWGLDGTECVALLAQDARDSEVAAVVTDEGRLLITSVKRLI